MAEEGSLHLRASALRKKERSLRNSYLCATCALLLVQGCSFHTYYIAKIMTIAPNKFVSVEYELYVGDENERVLMEQTTPDRPLEYIQGMGMMLPEFEKKLFGLKAGDKFDFVLKCDEAYGQPVDEAIQELPREIFVDGEGKLDALVVEGATLPLHTPDGQIVRGSVVEIKEEVVVMDFNHPLAGEDLHFIGSVKDVHDATPEEIEQFFGGHDGCGCGCGEDHEHEHEGGCGGGCSCH